MAPPLPLILLLMIQGVYSDDGWGVTYSPLHICALRDSTVTINCSYKYPTRYKITEVFWTNTDSSDPPNLSKDSKYSERIQYLGDKQHDCSVRLTDVRHTDSHEYYFRFTTHIESGKWIGRPGVTLDVTDLQVESEGERVMEGHSVTLTCESRCSLTDTSTFIWFRNTQTLNDTNKKLILPSVRRENAGDYSCAVQGHKLTSPPRRLNVIYPPDDPVISISSSGVIVEGDSVNLTCSSESNPPVHNYSWFKEETSVGSGNIYIISNIKSDHSGEYKCKTENELGQNNSTVTLNVLYPPRNVSASISSSGVIVEGDSVTLTCSSESNPPANISWFKEEAFVGSGNIYIISNIRSDHSGQYKCKTENYLGQNNSTVTLNVLYPPRNVSASISSSGVIVEGDSVTLTCSSESNPPANISWFKEETFVGSGNIYIISNIRSDHSGQYKCKTENELGQNNSTVTLNVLYPPRNVSASISSSGVIVEGDSVNLTCSSESNPPANISWFKEEAFVGSGNIYIISNIRSDLSGQYKCKAINNHGHKYSAVTLNVLYHPRNVTASISSSGVIVEGDSVNLTCSSESNPPANISWFKEETFVGSGNIYIISNIRSDHSGQYKCKTENYLGQNNSTVTLNVLYPPRNVSASISSSGVIVEGDSVTLTCSSESNPPANISWFKEETFVGSGNIFIISNIRSDHSGQYKCKTENYLGQNNSTVTLNVLYPPRNVSTSISSSGVIVEGDSVNLTCSSESNPPVHIYSWFKENQTSSVGSGQTFIISNFNSSLSGWFYCVPQNEVGSQRSASVSITVKGGGNVLHVVAGVTAGCGGLIFILIVVFVWKCKHRPDDIRHAQDDIYSTVTNRVLETESRDSEEILYATVRFLRFKDVKTSEETEDVYENPTLQQHDASERSDVHMMEDQSVIYSTLKYK
ncbi:Myelin-associated glycoprotein [Triplophysa tibetana]|uniref:B-cell receptor CD22 n=1 Tax=Triplophysa tibetana TaxID=1572043 RepID=A0A5A9PIZ5_9TELE|nr:Myelin-associated glycoprotein [Triplophysa tibetana]